MFNKLLIFKNNLINNVKQVKRRNQNSKVCAIVKANAYGVGAKDVVTILNDYVDFFGVACFFEAKNIEKLTNKRILILGALEKDCVDERFSYSCGSFNDAKFFVSLDKVIKVHLKINSGMNRFGFGNIKEFKKALMVLSKSKVIVEGIFTHFATVDKMVEMQMEKFNEFIKVCFNYGFNPIVHADNSFVNEKYNHCLDMVRIGFSLFGRDNSCFLSAVEIKSKVVNVLKIKKDELVGYNYRFVANKKMRVAIVPVGYADGFKINFIGMKLMVGDSFCKVLNVCMDCFMLDVSGVKIKKGDEIAILNKFNSLNIYADYIKTSPYEILTNFMSLRAQRVLI